MHPCKYWARTVWISLMDQYWSNLDVNLITSAFFLANAASDRQCEISSEIKKGKNKNLYLEEFPLITWIFYQNTVPEPLDDRDDQYTLSSHVILYFGKNISDRPNFEEPLLGGNKRNSCNYVIWLKQVDRKLRTFSQLLFPKTVKLEKFQPLWCLLSCVVTSLSSKKST